MKSSLTPLYKRGGAAVLPPLLEKGGRGDFDEEPIPLPRREGLGEGARPARSTISIPVLRSIILALALCLLSQPCFGSVYDFFRVTTPGTFFAIDPDLLIRSMDPTAPHNMWTLGHGWGVRPLFFHSQVPGLFDRVDFFYPLGCREESRFRSKLRLTPFFESRWSKLPPYDGFSRCLTLYHGKSDLGQDYWGVFPFYGYTHRRFGVDHNFFLLFPLYYESTEDQIRTFRILWPIGTYANGPGRSSFKVWPIYGQDRIKNEYYNRFVLWPLFQWTEKHPGTEQASSYTAFPFPLYMRQQDCYSTSTHILWPFLSLYKHFSGYSSISLRPIFSYGSGGGIEEFSFLFIYSSKKDYTKASASKTSAGYVAVGDGEVLTEKTFLYLGRIKKLYRNGCLVHSKYRFWPFAEYTWDSFKGSHLTVPEIIPLKNDWWDLNLGRLLRFVDFRDTPITRELSMLFGLSQRTELKSHPHIGPPPKPGEDSWSELIAGSFAKR